MREGIFQMAMYQEHQTPLRLEGEDVRTGLRDWVKGDLKESPKLGYDLGKFFFTVSVGTIGTLTAIEKSKTHLIFSFVFLFFSIIVALLMALPRRSSISGEADLLQEYEKCVDRIVHRSWIWFALWFFGAVAGVWAIGQ